MILHLDPTTGAASLLSIPRDLFVPLPAHSMAGSVGKIDAALNDGPNNLITAITNDLGIPINHYVESQLRRLPADHRRHRRDQDELPDAAAGHLFQPCRITQTGCQQLNGATALAVVRARHLQYFANGRWQDDPAVGPGPHPARPHLPADLRQRRQGPGQPTRCASTPWPAACSTRSPSTPA